MSSDLEEGYVCYTDGNGGERMVAKVVGFYSRNMVVAEVEGDPPRSIVVHDVKDATGRVDLKTLSQIIDDPLKVQWVGTIVPQN